MSYILDICDLESKTCKWQSIGTQGPPGSGGGDANFVLENVGCNRPKFNVKCSSKYCYSNVFSILKSFLLE